MCDYLRAPNFLLPEDMAPDFSAVAVAEDGTGTKLFTLMSVRTDYVVLVYLPSVAMVGELLALRDNLDKFTEVRYYLVLCIRDSGIFFGLFVYPVQS